jgi:hypothetical protein
MLMFFLFFAWIWLLVMIFSDIFRRDMSGWGKAGWAIFVIVLPLLGSLIYLIANGGDMQERRAQDIQAMDAAQKDYIRQVAGSGGSAADELTKLAALHDSGKLTDEEFATQKSKLLA